MSINIIHAVHALSFLFVDKLFDSTNRFYDVKCQFATWKSVTEFQDGT